MRCINLLVMALHIKLGILFKNAKIISLLMSVIEIGNLCLDVSHRDWESL